MAYLKDILRTELNKNNSSGRSINYILDLEAPRPSKNYLIGKSKYCNIILPEGYEYTANYNSVISFFTDFNTGPESYIGDLKTRGRTVVETREQDGKMCHPVQCLELKPATTADRIHKLKNEQYLTFGSEKDPKYEILYKDGNFVKEIKNDKGKVIGYENLLNDQIITHVIGTSDLASITIPNRTRNVEIKNVDLFHSAVLNYATENGKRKWGVIDLGTKGKTHIRRNGLIEPIKCIDEETEDHIEPMNGRKSYYYSIFKLRDGDEILLNGIEDKELIGAYVLKFLETIEGKN
jgi:hypothetical protein